MRLLQPLRQINRNCAARDMDRSPGQAGEDAVGPEHKSFDRIVGRQHGDHRLPRRRLGGGCGDPGAIPAQRLGPHASAIEDRHLMTPAEQAARHRPTHGSNPDDADIHAHCPPLMPGDVGPLCRFGQHSFLTADIAAAAPSP
jgi:hypothetical protein